MTSALSILQNLGLLSLGAIALLLLNRYAKIPDQKSRQHLLYGLILGAISALVVGVPIEGPLGARFDTRAAPLVLAGYFAGPAGGLVAASIAAVARYHVGGATVLGGIVSVFLYPAAGVVFAAVCRRVGRSRQGISGFLALSLIASGAVLPAFFVGLTFSQGLTILQSFWLVFLIGNVAGITLLGLTIEFLLEIEHERHRYRVDLQTMAIARKTARIGVWSKNLETRQLTWDTVQHDIMGVAPETFDESDKGLLNRVLPEDRARVAQTLKSAQETGSPFHMQFRIVTPAGELRHIKSHGHFLRDKETGALRDMIGIDIDVSHEAALLAEIELNSAALESAVCGVVIASAAGDHPIVYVNTAFTAITGYQAEDALGGNCRILNRGLEDQPELATIREAISRGESCTVTLQNRRKDGIVFWNTLNLSPIRDSNGVITHFIGVQEDVTERVTAQQIISESRDQIEAILVAAPDAIMSVDSEHRITNFNDAAVQLFGWSCDEIIGESIHTLVPTAARPAHVGLVSNYIADPNSVTGRMSDPRVVRGRRKDGTTFPALVSIARYQIGGKPMVTVSAHDMSEIVEANEELIHLSGKLSDQLEAAHRANEAKDNFLAHMSHELRTPLNAIIGFADMLGTLGIERLGVERTGEYVGDIKHSGELLLSLINDILDLSKLEAGRVDVTITPVDARSLIEEALAVVAPAFAAKNIEITTDFHDPGTVLCDRRLTLQCLLNLLSNAAKFSPRGSQITARIASIDDTLCFTVEDQGSGIPEDILNRIGEPFLRHDNPLTSNGDGSGLGLAITKNLVEKQNGSLRITRGRNGGTIASIWLPARQTIKAAGKSVELLR